MYTTSRYASADTRGFARRLATRNREPYVARGKKTIAQLAAMARKIGEECVIVVEERGGKPAILSAIKVDELGKWKWAGESAVGAESPGGDKK